MVCVSPGILDTNVIVAPNSPKAFAKPTTAPAKIPGRLNGKVTKTNTFTDDAPKVLAASSSLGSTASKAKRIARTIKGKAITAAANAAPAEVNANCSPRTSSGGPKIPLRPKAISKRYPVTTGGKTKGRCTSALSRPWPQNRRRAKI